MAKVKHSVSDVLLVAVLKPLNLSFNGHILLKVFVHVLEAGHLRSGLDDHHLIPISHRLQIDDLILQPVHTVFIEVALLL
jgi:hypothetical protein